MIKKIYLLPSVGEILGMKEGERESMGSNLTCNYVMFIFENYTFFLLLYTIGELCSADKSKKIFLKLSYKYLP
jgi:hypothetical protein